MPGRQILTVTGQRELRRLASDLRSAGNQQVINERLRRELMEVGRKGAAEVRARVRATPSKGQSARAGRRSLRAAVARSVEVKVRNTTRPGVIIWTNPGRMPPREQSLPAYLEGVFQPWRHPRWGDKRRGNWFNQRPHPYFYSALDSIAGDLADAGDRVLNRTANEIERG